MFAMKRYIAQQALCIACAIGTFGILGLAQQNKPQTETKAHTMTAQEQDAVKVIAEWEAAWSAGDADKMISLMAEDCEFRADPSDAQLGKGRTAYAALAKRFTGAGGGNGPRDFKITPGTTYAVGGENGATAILRQRVDTFTLGGRPTTVPVVAFFRVKDGHIEEWMDMPLVDVSKLFPRPPAGQGGAAPPSNPAANQ